MLAVMFAYICFKVWFAGLAGCFLVCGYCVGSIIVLVGLGGLCACWLVLLCLFC